MAKDIEKTSAQLQTELDDLLAWFESDKLDIDKAAEKYETGLKLIAQIEKRLKAAENKVSKLAASFDKPATEL